MRPHLPRAVGLPIFQRDGQCRHLSHQWDRALNEGGEAVRSLMGTLLCSSLA